MPTIDRPPIVIDTNVLLDLFVWQVLPDGMTWLGAGIIVASGLYLLHRERIQQARQKLPLDHP